MSMILIVVKYKKMWLIALKGFVVSPLLYKDVPVMGQTGINVQIGTNTKIGVSPSLFATSQVAKDRFTPQQRKCYFPVSAMVIT